MWDDAAGKPIGELCFRSNVKAVRLRRDRVVVALEHKVLVYQFEDFKLLHTIETMANERGLVALSSAAESIVLASPGLHSGQVRIELYDRKQTRFINAHKAPLSQLVLSLEGKRLATASEKGTLIRVWSTSDGALLQELRRGADQATITGLALSKDCDWLAVSSLKGTAHVFALTHPVQPSAVRQGSTSGHSNDDKSAKGPLEAPSPFSPGSMKLPEAQPPASNPTSSILGLLKSFLPTNITPTPFIPSYLTSEWSFAQFKLQPEDAAVGSVVGFGSEPGVLYVVALNGSFYRVAFDTSKGGACTQEAYFKLFSNQNDL